MINLFVIIFIDSAPFLFVADVMFILGGILWFRSLGVQRILENTLKLFFHPACLVLVLNTSPYEEEYFVEKMLEEGVEQLPKTVNSEVTRDDRWGVLCRARL